MASRSVEFHIAATNSVARAPSAADKLTDRFVRWVTLLFAWSTIALGAYIVLQVAWASRAAVSRFGFGLLGSSVWDESRELFGLVV